MTTRLALALVAIAALTIGPAIFEGSYSNRWGMPANLSASAERLQKFPMSFGEWKCVGEREKLPPVVCQELGLVGYLSKEYQNHQTGETVVCLLMVGQPGKLMRHEPDICYANRDNKQEGKPIETMLANNSNDKFRTLKYTPPSPTQNKFTVTYGMRTDESHWDVPYWRQSEYMGSSHLFKIQVLSMAQAGNFDDTIATSKAFLSDFVVAFDSWLAKNDVQ